ncbi:unnamed protein product, partial [Rotaria sp. Silwood2]
PVESILEATLTVSSHILQNNFVVSITPAVMDQKLKPIGI